LGISLPPLETPPADDWKRLPAFHRRPGERGSGLFFYPSPGWQHANTDISAANRIFYSRYCILNCEYDFGEIAAGAILSQPLSADRATFSHWSGFPPLWPERAGKTRPFFFNNPFGAYPERDRFRLERHIDAELVIPD